MTDPISDLFTRIKNGYRASHKEVVVPWSKMKAAIAQVLVKESFLAKMAVKIEPKTKKKVLILTLKYDGKKPAVSEMRRISKPGCRRYFKSKKIIPVQSGLGVNLISTSRGVMTGWQAKQKKLGGEIIGQIW